MQMVLQFINHKNGQRSEPFVATAAQLRDSLREAEEVNSDDLILCVGYVTEEEEMRISGNPLMTVKSFLETFDSNLQIESEIEND